MLISATSFATRSFGVVQEWRRRVPIQPLGGLFERSELRNITADENNPQHRGLE
jgi:hypothetical protein